MSTAVCASTVAAQRSLRSGGVQRGRAERRNSINDSSVNATIGSRLTALSTGVAPSRMRLYSITVSGASDPTRLGTIA